MKEEKFKRIVVGVTAAAVILLVILLVYMIYQLIAISVREKRIAELEEQYAYWEQYVKENEGWLEIIARKLGMLGAGDYGKDASVSFEDGALLKISDSGEILYEICGD